MPEIKLDRVSVYGAKKEKILDNISLDIEEGSFVCLLGPTGSGKTTLLKTIAGLVAPSRGTVYFDNVDVTTFKHRSQDVSMVFENFVLYPHMSVFQNIASPLLAKKLPKHEIKEKVKEVTRLLKIEYLLDRKIKQLSGGEMQRVSIGRALAKEAKIMLFDEIFVNLDYKLREQMKLEFKDLISKVKLTSIFATPDAEEAQTFGEKVALIYAGKICQYDKKDVVYNQPLDVFTGRYFGYPEMNILDCVITEKNGGLEINADLISFSLSSKYVKNHLRIGRYLLGIRPENIKISEEGKKEGIESRGELMLTEVIGSDTIVQVAVGENILKMFVPRIYREDIGKQIYINFDPQLIYLFDKETGKLIGRGV